MAPPLINPHVRFKARGVTPCYWVPTIANPAAPTRGELDAGLNLSKQIMAIDGWAVSSEKIETPDLGTEYTGNIPGSTSSDDSSLTFYSDKNGNDIRQVLPRGEDGFIVWLHGGDIPGNHTMDVYPVRVGSRGKPVSLDDEACSIEVGFFITDEPQEDLEIPA